MDMDTISEVLILAAVFGISVLCTAYGARNLGTFDNGTAMPPAEQATDNSMMNQTQGT